MEANGAAGRKERFQINVCELNSYIRLASINHLPNLAEKLGIASRYFGWFFCPVVQPTALLTRCGVLSCLPPSGTLPEGPLSIPGQTLGTSMDVRISMVFYGFLDDERIESQTRERWADEKSKVQRSYN